MRAPRLALLAGAGGATATATAAGWAAERYAVRRLRRRPDPEAGEPFGRLPGRRRAVRADDGVPLHVQEVGPGDAPLTVVLCHGYALESAAWHYQRRDLADGSRPVRLVLWDQRGHGRSARATPQSCTIGQVGRDLARVLAETAPTGPVALVGHSMGGMGILALAGAQPELFDGRRVAGVALLSTSAGRLAEVTFGLPAALTGLRNRALPWLAHGSAAHPRLVERGRSLTADASFLLTRRFGFGSGDVSPSVVSLVERMVAQTPVEVLAAFYPTFTHHDELAALPVLDGVETLVLAGEEDLVTPAAHAEEIGATAPAARVLVLPRAGHNLMLEQPAQVNAHLGEFLDRVLARSAGAEAG
jgi:pimeloyl-ACP methyl ester carboxylesterase